MKEPFTIQWKRNVEIEEQEYIDSQDDTIDNWVTLPVLVKKMTAEYFALEVVLKEKLSSVVVEFKLEFPGNHICFMIEGIDDFLKKEEERNPPRVNRCIL